jgi:hypothetical protein
MIYVYYAKCSVCKYYEETSSLQKARDIIERHEQLKHKKKPVGIFGKKRSDNGYV